MLTTLRPTTTVELLARLAADVPERVAFSADPGHPQSTFAALWRSVSMLASALQARGIQRGQRVAIALPNCVDWSMWEYASQVIGAVPVGLGMQWSREHTSAVLADCEPAVLVLADRTALSLVEPNLLERCRIVCVREGQGVDGACTQSELLASANSTTVEVVCQAADAATIIYTSGSTGKPKGVMHTHARVMGAVSTIVDLFPELEGGRLALSWMPMEHLFQRMLNLVALSLGMETSILSDPRNVLDAARTLQPTFLAGVPLIFEQLLRAASAEPSPFEAWRRALKVMIVGSAPISLDVLERLARLGFPVTQAYSTTECLVPIASNTLSANRPGSVGKPVESYDLRFSDAGEILVRGPGVFDGYYRDSHRQVDDAGYYNTGDLGYLDADGYLFITGRNTDLLKTAGGRKISPFEIESAYKRCPHIEQVVVGGHGRRRLVALVQLERTWAASVRDAVGVPYDDGGAWADDARVIDAVLAEMQRFDASLDDYKKVRRICVLARPLSVEAGELTPTFKLRRDVIEQRHRARLERVMGSA